MASAITRHGATGGIAAVIASLGTMAVDRYFNLQEAELVGRGDQIERDQCTELLGTMQDQWRILVEQCRANCDTGDIQ